MGDIYDSHEQGERVKSWLRENGGAILMGLVLAFGGLFGFKQWQVWQVGKMRQASAEYETMVELLTAEQLDTAVGNYETLKNEYPNSAYLPMASLHMAKARVEAGQADLAIGLLEQAMNEGRPEALQVVARERLARLKLDQGDAAGALSLIDGAPSDLGFESRFAEIRGDIHKAMGDEAEALAQYNRALELQDTGVNNRALIEMKIEALGGAGGEGQDS